MFLGAPKYCQNIQFQPAALIPSKLWVAFVAFQLEINPNWMPSIYYQFVRMRRSIVDKTHKMQTQHRSHTINKSLSAVLPLHYSRAVFRKWQGFNSIISNNVHEYTELFAAQSIAFRYKLWSGSKWTKSYISVDKFAKKSSPV